MADASEARPAAGDLDGHPGAPARIGIDRETSAEHLQSLADAEEAQPAARTQVCRDVRGDSDPRIGDRHAEPAVVKRGQFDAGLLGVGVLDDVQEQFTHGLEEEQTGRVVGRFGGRGGGDLDVQSVLLLDLAAQPLQRRSARLRRGPGD